MKRTLSLVLALGLLVGGAVSAEAAKKAKPVKTTLYLHGTETLGELDHVNSITGAYTRMDPTEPTGPAPKSRPMTFWWGSPFNQCAGYPLASVWTGNLSGKVVGDLTLTIHSVAVPGTVRVQIWPDVAGMICAGNDLSEGEFPAPVVDTVATVGPGETEIVLENVGFKAVGSMMLQILSEGPGSGRLLYDSPEFDSRIEFNCIPKAGKACA